MRITYVVPEDETLWDSVEWRCAAPARAINRTGRHQASLLNFLDFSEDNQISKAVCEESDVIVVYRNLWGPALSTIQHYQARDKVVVADFQEAYHLLEPEDHEYRFWAEGAYEQGGKKIDQIDPPPLTQFKWGLQLVNGATVPSKRLADDFQAYVRIEHVPDYIETERYAEMIPETHEGIILGWKGRSSHLRSFQASGVLEALQEVCQQRPRVQVMICCEDQKAVENLGLPAGKLIYRPWKDGSDWPSPLARFDIGLAPLRGPLDQRRGWASVLEYLIMKIPWVASQGPAYYELRPYGWLVENTAGTWQRILLDMIDHLDDYKFEAAQAPYLFGLSQSLEENVYQLVDTYAQIVERASGISELINRPAIRSSLLTPEEDQDAEDGISWARRKRL
jgi:glycosyltransferase involved in cell wall biosynthesis